MYPYNFLSIEDEEVEDFCSANGYTYREMEMVEAMRTLLKRIQVLEEKLGEDKDGK